MTPAEGDRADARAPAARARASPLAARLGQGRGRSWRLSRARIAELLRLPKTARRRSRSAAQPRTRTSDALGDASGGPPRDAGFAVYGERVQVVPARDGLEVNVPAGGEGDAPRGDVDRRTAWPASPSFARQPERSTAEALAMGIDRRMSSYKTYYSGTSDRITNLQLGVAALDGTLVPPGGTFSLNDAIGERTVERGFRPAPVIIGNEYAEEVGGGTSQVATTVFNAAWEAGLRITERHPHSLYISRYQLGRDATVYWPSLDLKFVNDTEQWVLVKGFAEGDGISVAIYGGETRRVESSAGPLVVTGRVPVERVKDPKLAKGKTVVEDEGTAPTRDVRDARDVLGGRRRSCARRPGHTSYKGETRVVRVGTKVAPKPKKPKPAPATARAADRYDDALRRAGASAVAIASRASRDAGRPVGLAIDDACLV